MQNLPRLRVIWSWLVQTFAIANDHFPIEPVVTNDEFEINNLEESNFFKPLFWFIKLPLFVITTDIIFWGNYVIL